MLVYLTRFIQRSMIMAFYSRSTIHNYARPFDEIIYSYNPTATTTIDTNQCPVSIATKDTLT